MSYISYLHEPMTGGRVKGVPNRCVEFVPKRRMTKPPTEKQLIAREKIARAGKYKKMHPEVSMKEAYDMANGVRVSGKGMRGGAFLGGCEDCNGRCGMRI